MSQVVEWLRRCANTPPPKRLCRALFTPASIRLILNSLQQHYSARFGTCSRSRPGCCIRLIIEAIMAGSHVPYLNTENSFQRVFHVSGMSSFFYDDIDVLWISIIIAVVCIVSLIDSLHYWIRSGERTRSLNAPCKWLRALAQPSKGSVRWFCGTCGEFEDTKLGRRPKRCLGPYRRTLWS